MTQAININVKVYDHTTTLEQDGTLDVKGLLLKQLYGLAEPIHLGIADESKAIEKLKDALIVIGHFGTTENWELLLNLSTHGSIRIRTSSIGRYQYPNRVTDNNVIELNLKPKHTELDSCDWNYLLTELQKEGTALSIAEGKIPSDMDYFFGGSFPEILTTLSVLCQGYLAVMKPSLLGLPHEPIIDAFTLRKAKTEVCSPEWWRKVFTPPKQTLTTLSVEKFNSEWPEHDTNEGLIQRATAINFISKILHSDFSGDFTKDVASATNAFQYGLSNRDKS